MRLAVASDHAGHEYRLAIAEHLRGKGHEVVDFGTKDGARCDYPDLALPAATAVAQGECERGILVCGSGIGVSMTANKVPGIRCALAHNVETATLAKAHNDAHMLALGARIVALDTALAMVDAYLDSEFESRHQTRLDKLAAIDERFACAPDRPTSSGN